MYKCPQCYNADMIHRIWYVNVQFQNALKNLLFCNKFMKTSVIHMQMMTFFFIFKISQDKPVNAELFMNFDSEHLCNVSSCNASIHQESLKQEIWDMFKNEKCVSENGIEIEEW